MALQKGMKLEMFLTHVDTQGKYIRFWAQTSFTDSQAIDQRLEDVKDTLSAMHPVSTEVSPGDFCLVRLVSENRWFRARAIERGHDSTTVHLLDYGSTEHIANADVRTHVPQFFDLPPLAHLFILADMIPREGSTWTENECAQLLNLMFKCYNASILYFSCGNIPVARLSAEKSEIPVSYTHLTLPTKA